jgi:hypothetical protein
MNERMNEYLETGGWTICLSPKSSLGSKTGLTKGSLKFVRAVAIGGQRREILMT